MNSWQFLKALAYARCVQKYCQNIVEKRLWIIHLNKFTQSDDVKESPSHDETIEIADNTEVVASGKQASDSENRDLSDDFTLVSRAKAFQTLLLELESYFQDGNDHAQMIIQRQVDDM